MDITTLDYYNNNAQAYIKDTVGVDMSSRQDRFLKLLPQGAHILDFGCGSGRDSKYFLERGFKVTAIDGSAEFCKHASLYTGLSVKQMYFQDLAEVGVYDAVWACASILHLPKNELEMVLGKIRDALVAGGVLYTSFKYGDFEGPRNGRYFTFMTEPLLQKMLAKVGSFEVVEMWTAGDVRPGRAAEMWLNVLARKE